MIIPTWRPQIALYAATAGLVLATAAAAVQSWRLHREQLAHSRTVTAHAIEERNRTELAREYTSPFAELRRGATYWPSWRPPGISSGYLGRSAVQSLIGRRRSCPAKYERSH